jgi:hypothetical protein
MQRTIQEVFTKRLLAKMKERRASGEVKRKAGDHKGSAEDLPTAEDILKIQHLM